MNRKQRRALKLQPKLKTVKTVNAAGFAEYQEVGNLDMIIAVAAEILRDEPDNEKARAVVEWALSFAPGKPTDADFMAFAPTVGFSPTEHATEEMDN